MGNWGGSPATAAGLTPAQRHGRSRSAQVRLARNQIQRSPGPQRSPTDISLAQLEFESEDGDDADLEAAYAASRAASGTSMSGAVGSSSGGSAPRGTQPEVIPNLPQGQSQSQGLGLLDVTQPPPEYSSPVDRSILSARRDAERQQQQHPPRTSSKRHQKQRQRYPEQYDRQTGQNGSPASRSQAHRKHRQRRDYFDTSSASPSSASESGSGGEYEEDSQPESPFAERQRRRDDRRRRRKKRQARFYADSPDAAVGPSANNEPYRDEPEAERHESRYRDEPEEEEQDVTPRPLTQDRSPPVPYEVAVGESVPESEGVGPSRSRPANG